MDQPSGCGAQVSSLFWPTPDRRNLFMGEKLDGEPARYSEENEERLRGCAHALAVLIELSTERNVSEECFRPALALFPGQAASTAPSKYLAEHFYNKILPDHPAMNCTVWGLILQDWGFLGTVQAELQLDHPWFHSLTNNWVDGEQEVPKDAIRQAYRDIGLQVVELSHTLFKSYTIYGILGNNDERVIRLSAPTLRKRLAGAPGITAQAARVLFQICASDNQLGQLEGLQLCRTYDGAEVRYLTKDDSRRATGCVSEAEASLAAQFDSSEFALFSSELARKLIAEELLRPLNSEFLSHFLHGKPTTPEIVRVFFQWVEVDKPKAMEVFDGCDALLIPTYVAASGGPTVTELVRFSERIYCVPDSYCTFSPLLKLLGVHVVAKYAECIISLGGDTGTSILLEAIVAAKQAGRWDKNVSTPTDEQTHLWRELLQIFMQESRCTANESMLREVVQAGVPLFASWASDGGFLQPCTASKFLFCPNKFGSVLSTLRSELPAEFPVLYEEEVNVQDFIAKFSTRIVRITSVRDLMVEHRADLFFPGRVQEDDSGFGVMLDETMQIVVKEGLLTKAELHTLKFVPGRDNQRYYPQDAFLWSTDFIELDRVNCEIGSLLCRDWAEGKFLVARLRELGLRATLNEQIEHFLLIDAVEKYVAVKQGDVSELVELFARFLGQHAFDGIDQTLG